MVSFRSTAAATLALLSSAYVLAQDLTIATPASLYTCQPVQLSWSGGTSPYFVYIIPGGDTTSQLAQFGQMDGTTYTWTVDIAAGTSIGVGVTDANGVSQYSAPVTINAGSSTDCVGSSSGSASSATDSMATSMTDMTSSAADATDSAMSTAADATSSAGSAASDATQSASDAAESATPDNAAGTLKIGSAVFGMVAAAQLVLAA